MIFWPTHTLILLMAESVRIVAIGDLIFFKSQTFTVRSSLPETTLSPTVNTAEVTVLSGNERVQMSPHHTGWQFCPMRLSPLVSHQPASQQQ